MGSFGEDRTVLHGLGKERGPQGDRECNIDWPSSITQLQLNFLSFNLDLEWRVVCFQRTEGNLF